MEIPAPWPWLRRLLAHLTTLVLIGVSWWLMPGVDHNGAELWAAIMICCFAWVMLGVPAALLRRSRPPSRPWPYTAWGAGLGLMTLLVLEEWRDPQAWVAVAGGAIAGTWYWFCAHWRAGPGAREEASAA